MIGFGPAGSSRSVIFREQYRSAAGESDGQVTEHGNVGAQRLGQAHDHHEWAVAVEHLARLPPAGRGSHRFLDIGHADAIARQHLAARRDRQHRQARDLYHLHILRACKPPQQH